MSIKSDLKILLEDYAGKPVTDLDVYADELGSYAMKATVGTDDSPWFFLLAAGDAFDWMNVEECEFPCWPPTASTSMVRLS